MTEFLTACWCAFFFKSRSNQCLVKSEVLFYCLFLSSYIMNKTQCCYMLEKTQRWGGMKRSYCFHLKGLFFNNWTSWCVWSPIMSYYLLKNNTLLYTIYSYISNCGTYLKRGTVVPVVPSVVLSPSLFSVLKLTDTNAVCHIMWRHWKF